ncbi:MAG: transketolase family protein [Deltaproteobacteria bacterium]|nr:transketolase family protein [Deltaproteobacteria bacterium]
MAEIATREAYGKKLADLGDKYPNIVVLDADLSCSTKTGVFAAKFPDRFFNMGVAEQDMMGTAAGLAASGKIVFVSTFAIFATGRAWEPFRQSAAYPHLNVKVCATHAGLTVGEDGASHQTVEDIAVMRVIPGVKVFVPADGVETEKVLEEIVKTDGPCYVRLSRAKSPVLFDAASYQFRIGKGNILREGSDLCVFTAGYMTSIVLEAAKKLEEKKISTTVVNMASVKPIDEELIAAMPARHRFLASVEEHSVIGGLGSAVAEVLTARAPARLIRVGVDDQFGQSGDYLAVLKHYGLDAEGVANTILKNIS